MRPLKDIAAESGVELGNRRSLYNLNKDELKLIAKDQNVKLELLPRSGTKGDRSPNKHTIADAIKQKLLRG